MTTPPNIMVQLIHIHGGLKGEIQGFYDRLITVGRLSACSVRFPADEPGVSREHARIEREGNQFKLIDVSKYGTSVNGKRVQEVWLRNGDVLEFGPGGPKVSFTMELVASLPGSASAAAPADPGRALPAGAAALREPPLPKGSPAASPIPPGQLQQAAAPPYQPAVQPSRDAHQPPVQPPREAYPQQGPLQVQKSVAPLVIQYGPTIRSFRELPVTLGGGGQADFVIRHHAVQELHLQIFFGQERYWVRDLTGQGAVTVNRRRIADQAQLNLNDEIELAAQGPVFRFLGEGRLAEVEQAPEQSESPRGAGDQKVADTALTHNDGNFFSKLVKGFKP